MPNILSQGWSTFKAQWNLFWFAPSSGRPEAYFRAGYSLVLLCDLTAIYPLLRLFFSNQGAHPPSSLDFLFPPEFVYCFFYVWVFCAVMLLLGIKARLFSVLNFVCVLYFWYLRGQAAPHASNWITHAMAFHLLFMKSDRRLSLSRDRKSQDDLYCVWPARLAQISFAGIYFTTGISKLPDPGWVSGIAFRDTLLHPIFSNFDFSWVSSYESALKIITYAITTFEISVPLLLIFKKTRPLTVLGLLLFQLGIDATIKVGWFALFATAYLMIFVDDLSLKFLDKNIPGRKHALKASWAARAFICFHLIAFSISHVSFFVKAVRYYDPGKIPIFSAYSSLAGIQEFRVWPTGFFLNPVKFLFLEAVHPDGTLEPISPYNKNGEYAPGLLLVRQARPGLFVFRIASFGISEKKWHAFVDYLLFHYQSNYGKACPKELRVSLIRDSLENFRGAPKKMAVEKPLILTAEMNCEKARPSFDLQFTEFGKSFIAEE